MGDTGNLASDQDLLDLLTGGGAPDSGDAGETSLEEALSGTETTFDDSKSEEDKKMEELRSLADSIQNSVDGMDSGSGDLNTDLANWFDGVSNLPSTPLTHYVANPVIKSDYALTKSTLSNYKLMDKLQRFITEDAFDSLFSESAIMGLDAEDLEKRVRLATDIYARLYSLNEKTMVDTKTIRLKGNDTTDDLDRLSLLISSIPEEKLEALLREISYTNVNIHKEDS